MLELNLYKNNNTSSRFYGKAYARVSYKKNMSLEDLANHMAEHNTPFSKGTIQGILKDMVACIRELTLEGHVIKIDNLALFKCSVESNPMQRYAVARAAIGPTQVKDPATGEMKDTGFAVKNVKLLAQATGEYVRAELNKDSTFKWTELAQSLIDEDRQPEP